MCSSKIWGCFLLWSSDYPKRPLLKSEVLSLPEADMMKTLVWSSVRVLPNEARLGTKIPFFDTLMSIVFWLELPSGSKVVNGFLVARKRVDPPWPDWILPFVRSCAINPLNLLKVRGILISGLTSMLKPFWVLMITRSLWSLFKGESSRANRHWWAISGRNSSGDLLSLVSISFEWSSQLISCTPFFVLATSNDLQKKA